MRCLSIAVSKRNVRRGLTWVWELGKGEILIWMAYRVQRRIVAGSGVKIEMAGKMVGLTEKRRNEGGCNPEVKGALGRVWGCVYVTVVSVEKLDWVLRAVKILSARICFARCSTTSKSTRLGSESGTEELITTKASELSCEDEKSRGRSLELVSKTTTSNVRSSLLSQGSSVIWGVAEVTFEREGIMFYWGFYSGSGR